VADRKLQTNREENFTKYTESMHAYVKKAEKIGTANGERGGEREEKTRSIIENKNIIFFHFKFLEANLRGGKGGTFMVGPGRHFASLPRCSWLYSNPTVGRSHRRGNLLTMRHFTAQNLSLSCIEVGAGDSLGVLRIFYPKNLYATNFLPTSFCSCWYIVFLYQVAIDLKIENLVPEICFLIPQLKK